MGGMARREPILAGLWLLASFSLAGLPPLSGFFGKLGLIQVGLNQGQWLMVGVAAAVSLFTLFSMLKIWNEVFWKQAYAEQPATPRASALLIAPSALLVALSIAIGFGASPVLQYSRYAAEQVFNTQSLVQDICGPAGCDAVTSTANGQ
jgi:multicomponent Na+:H+ antiporter subunit D